LEGIDGFAGLKSVMTRGCRGAASGGCQPRKHQPPVLYPRRVRRRAAALLGRLALRLALLACPWAGEPGRRPPPRWRLFVPGPFPVRGSARKPEPVVTPDPDPVALRLGDLRRPTVRLRGAPSDRTRLWSRTPASFPCGSETFASYITACALLPLTGPGFVAGPWFSPGGFQPSPGGFCLRIRAPDLSLLPPSSPCGARLPAPSTP